MEIAQWGDLRLLAHTRKKMVACEWIITKEDSFFIICTQTSARVQLFVKYKTSSDEDILVVETDKTTTLSPIQQVLAAYVMKHFRSEMKKCKRYVEHSDKRWIDVTSSVSYLGLKENRYFGRGYNYFILHFSKWFRLLYTSYRLHIYPLVRVPTLCLYLRNMSEIQLGDMSLLHLASLNNDVYSMEMLFKRNPQLDLHVKLSQDHPRFPGCDPLRIAVTKGHSVIVRFLLLHGKVKVTAQNLEIASLMYLAFYKKHYNTAAVILSRYTDFARCPTDENGLSYFHIACFLGMLDVVQSFIMERSTDVNSRIGKVHGWHGCTGLHLAVDNQDTATMLILLSAGANPNIQDGVGATSLHHACKIGLQQRDRIISLIKCKKKNEIAEWISSRYQAEVIDLLMVFKADVDIADYFGETPLFYLYDAAVDVVLERRLRKFKRIDKIEKELNIKNLITNIICRKRHTLALKLIVHGAKWLIDPPKRYLIHSILRCHHSEETVWIVENLISLKKKTKIAVPDIDYLLYLACQKSRDCVLIEYFLDIGANPNREFFDSGRLSTAFITYVRRIPHEEPLFSPRTRIKKFVNHGADINYRLPNGKTALHVLFSRTELDGCDLTDKSVIGSHVFKTSSHLFNLKAEVNAQDASGRTPLHYACMRHAGIEILMLLRIGADVEIFDNDGTIPFNCCYITAHLSSSYINKMLRIGFDLSRRHLIYKEYPMTREDVRFVNAEIDKESSELRELRELQLIINENSRTRMDEVLFKTRSQMAKLVKTEAFCNWLQFRANAKNFPMLMCLLRLQYRRGVSRSLVLEPGKRALVDLMGIDWPDPYVERLTDYLDDQTMIRLIEAANI